MYTNHSKSVTSGHALSPSTNVCNLTITMNVAISDGLVLYLWTIVEQSIQGNVHEHD